MIFWGLRTICRSPVSFSQNSSGSRRSRGGANSRKAASKPGHFFSMTLQTNPAEKMRLAISESTRSSARRASPFWLGTLGRSKASAASPPLRLTARARMALKAVMGVSQGLAGMAGAASAGSMPPRASSQGLGVKPAHAAHFLPFLGRDGLHREPRGPHQGHVGELGIGLGRRQGYRLGHVADG